MKKLLFITLASIFLMQLKASITIGTPFTNTAKRVMVCGAGELGKEVIIELKRFGVEVIAVDSYPNAPGMQVADRSYVISMLDRKALRAIIEQEKPDLIVPEIEAIATDELVALEKEGYTVIPTAKATCLTMDREGIRRLAAEELKLNTSAYRFATSKEEYLQGIREIGLPCVVKPTMSSSGKGQSIIKFDQDILNAWEYAQSGARGAVKKVIIESFIDFDYEITLLTIRHKDGTSFCQPIGHKQINGDYRQSWQPHAMNEIAHNEALHIAQTITDALGGVGVFGVEMFVKGDTVWFNEVSPRPHDTGMVTMISQDLSEFALHVRAILGLPIPNIKFNGPAASCALLVEGFSDQVQFTNLQAALAEPDTDLRLFGKPDVKGLRRMGVALARAETVEQARHRACSVIEKIIIER
jgi:phosphoribosylglycinamide formyltransferase 2